MWVCIKVYTSTGNEIIMNDYVTTLGFRQAGRRRSVVWKATKARKCTVEGRAILYILNDPENGDHAASVSADCSVPVCDVSPM